MAIRRHKVTVELTSADAKRLVNAMERKGPKKSRRKKTKARKTSAKRRKMPKRNKNGRFSKKR